MVVHHNFPPKGTIYYHYNRWRKDGTWQHLNAALRGELRQDLGRFANLVGEGFIGFSQLLPELVFSQGIDEQAQAHDHQQSHDARRLLEKETVSEKQRVFEETEAALDAGGLLLVDCQQLQPAKLNALILTLPHSGQIVRCYVY